MRHATYIVIRRHALLGHAEYFGPVASKPSHIWHDANRLYGKQGYTVEWVAWSKATAGQKKRTKEDGNGRDAL